MIISIIVIVVTTYKGVTISNVHNVKSNNDNINQK